MHHVPGRLRVKVPAIKGDARQAQELCARLRARPGVIDAEANPVTGSVLVRYDVGRIGGDAVLARLREEGAACGGPLPRPQSHHGASAEWSQRLGEKAVDKLIETLVERSAIALVAALL